MTTDVCRFIQPYRNIPFDLGTQIKEAELLTVKNALLEKGCRFDPVPAVLSSLSDAVLLNAKVDENLRLFLYSFGIGVFELKDERFLIEQGMGEIYSDDYCSSRKQAHKSLLSWTHPYSQRLREIITCLRDAVKQGSRHKKLRRSAEPDWEHSGLSYVMTLSALCTGSGACDYSEMDEAEKRNICILLDPSLVHHEDSLINALTNLQNAEQGSLFNFDLSAISPPKNWLNVKTHGLYISWAAVLVYTSGFDQELVSLLQYFEIDLQAMWMYIYCSYDQFRHEERQQNLAVSKLKRLLFEFEKQYNSFKSKNDTSMPRYTSEIRSELLRTSGIDEEYNKCAEYLRYFIEETESLNIEKQKKYSWMNEILLFIIAFVQIAPMCYNLLIGNYHDLVLWPIIVLGIVVVLGIIFILRKD